MLKLLIFKNETELNKIVSKKNVIDFLFEHLGKYGDEKSAIEKAIDYAFSKVEGKGGFLEIALDNDEIVGVLVMNKTGMTGYIPKNILVYVAVRKDQRGKGVGKEIIIKAVEAADNDVALHVEYDNPAKRLYERIGFGTKYAEMRYIKE
ncbi:MAG: GNAT family N-acetyltransferase [Candidatus Cloacimonetes bacterium]|nr:GNAT family N-acetyltransferase [Candidatus Cloacimonadota bacterium]